MPLAAQITVPGASILAPSLPGIAVLELCQSWPYSAVCSVGAASGMDASRLIALNGVATGINKMRRSKSVSEVCYGNSA